MVSITKPFHRNLENLKEFSKNFSLKSNPLPDPLTWYSARSQAHFLIHKRTIQVSRVDAKIFFYLTTAESCHNPKNARDCVRTIFRDCHKGGATRVATCSLLVSVSLRQTCCYDMELLYYFLSHVENWVRRVDVGWMAEQGFYVCLYGFPPIKWCINGIHVEIISSY